MLWWFGLYVPMLFYHFFKYSNAILNAKNNNMAWPGVTSIIKINPSHKVLLTPGNKPFDKTTYL